MVVLAVVIATNTAIGFFQEYSSENTMAALKKLSAPTAKVIRSGKLETISSRQVVPGDIVSVEEGDQIPADLRLFEAVNLEIDEMLLTGESLPVRKKIEALAPLQGDESIPVGDRKNLAFSSTTVTRGRGKGIVVTTGLATEVGRIAKLLENDTDDSTPNTSQDSIVKDTSPKSRLQNFILSLPGFRKSHKTPLQKSLDRMMFSLLFICIILGIFVFWSNDWKWDEDVALYAVAVGVAIIPEGLPAVVTVTMAVGVRSMAQQKALVRKLVSLEAIGMVTNICSDKTGTLTEGKMAAKRCWVAGMEMDVEGGAMDPDGGRIVRNGDSVTKEMVEADHVLRNFFSCAALCNQASIAPPEDPLSTDASKSSYSAIGDPTEVALQVLAHRVKMGKPDLLSSTNSTFICELPFDPTLKRMTVIYANKTDQGHTLNFYLKGALERVLECCTSYYDQSGTRQSLSPDFTQTAHIEMERLASKGLRVLSIAHDETTGHTGDLPTYDIADRKTLEQKMTFIGLVGIYDPPRPTSAPSVETAKQAGITVHMATGDHASTATAIAHQIGILQPGQENAVYTASRFDQMTDAEIDALPQLPLVLARCSPLTKVKLVSALHRRNKFVAMTGDGTNDAPALKHSNIGIAMGTGSDVAKSASDIILTDDNFSSIVSAVREGRRIFDNICKFSLNFLSGNVAEVIVMVVGLSIRGSDGGAYFPLTAIQVLWVNMVTSSPVCLCLAREKASRDVMTKPPRGSSGKKTTSIFTKRFLFDVFFYGSWAGLLSLLSFIISLIGSPGGLHGYPTTTCSGHGGGYDAAVCSELYQARGVAFTTLNFLLLIHGWNCRSLNDSTLFAKDSPPRNNWALFWSIVVGFGVTLIVLLVPGLNDVVFGMRGFGWEWGVVFAAVVVFLVGCEIWKVGWRTVEGRKNRGRGVEHVEMGVV